MGTSGLENGFRNFVRKPVLVTGSIMATVFPYGDSEALFVLKMPRIRITQNLLKCQGTW